ncbi:response regulator [Fulvivirga sediminis]|uniref:Response regulator n=1 Tax=Fulvivirga sediminis TaxID=2803949 RepID=A0A937JYP7_9BACT|nr:response regulator [Fulvivirga sediminis]MBL3656633.1 response regulator [Fulvivirga sediminis]
MDILKKQTEEEVLKTIDTQKILKFFVVDDDEYYNTLVKSYLQKIGKENDFHAETYSYTDGSSCLAHLDENPDYIILDFYLDANNDITLTGYDVLEKIQQHNHKINIIVMSQKHEWANFEDEFKKFGAMGFLKKDDFFYNNLRSMIISDNIATA